jgi:large subunit ribosomal protein L7/L12
MTLDDLHVVKDAVPENKVNIVDVAIESVKKFSMVLVDVGHKKIEVIKVLREVAGFGLKEAKDFVEEIADDHIPMKFKGGVSDEEARLIEIKLEEAGARVLRRVDVYG